MKPESRSVRQKLALVSAFVFGLVAVATPLAHAQTFSVVHNFTGGNGGAVPFNGFTVGDSGGGSSHITAPHPGSATFYGTASSGGASNYGIVFSMNTSGGETVLHNFSGGTDGATPYGSLAIDKSGNLYGTTTAGGASGAGTVFEISGSTETVLYSFDGGTDGADPVAGLIQDATGNLYGTTSQGGASGNGTVFELAAPKTKGGAGRRACSTVLERALMGQFPSAA